MKKTTTICRLSALAAAAFIAASLNASAGSVTMKLGTVLAGGFTPATDLSSAPYVVATFTDVAGGVSLNLSCPGLGFSGSGNYQHVGTGAAPDGWLFNVTDAQVGHLTFAVTGTTIGATSSPLYPMPAGASIATFAVSQGLNAYDAATTAEKFDIDIHFAEADTMTEFGNGKSITYLITSNLAGGVSAADFAKFDASGTYYSAAQIDDTTKGTWVATTGTTQTVPDAASTATLLGLALLGLGGCRRMFCQV